MARAKKNITSASSNKEIMSLISSVNNRLRTFYGAKGLTDEERSAISEQMSNRVANILRFDASHASYELPLEMGKNGYFIPKTQASIDYIRETLTRQEEANEYQLSKDPDFKRSKTLAENLQDIKSFTERSKEIEEQLLKNPESAFSESKIRAIEPTMSKADKSEIKALNRLAVINEMYARTSNEHDISFGEAIDKVYEAGNDELIADLQNNKWTGDIMERVNVFAHGYEWGSEA